MKKEGVASYLPERDTSGSEEEELVLRLDVGGALDVEVVLIELLNSRASAEQLQVLRVIFSDVV